MIIHRSVTVDKLLNLYNFFFSNHLNIFKKNKPIVYFTTKQTTDNTNRQKIKIKANNIKNRKVFE